MCQQIVLQMPYVTRWILCLLACSVNRQHAILCYGCRRRDVCSSRSCAPPWSMKLPIHSYFLLPPHSCPPSPIVISSKTIWKAPSHRAWHRWRSSPTCESACGCLWVLCECMHTVYIAYSTLRTQHASRHHFLTFLSLPLLCSFPLSRHCPPLHTTMPLHFGGILWGIYLVHMNLVGSLTLCQVTSTNDMYYYCTPLLYLFACIVYAL